MRKIEEKELEEAILKLVAAEYVKNEGEKILKEVEKLNQEEDGKPGPEEMKQFEALCEKHLKKDEKTEKNWKIRFYRGGAVAAIVMLILGIGIESVSATKIPPMNFMTKVTEKFTEIRKLVENTGQDDENINNKEGETLDERFYVQFNQEYEITYLPEEFQAISYQKDKMRVSIGYSDKTNSDRSIEFLQQDINNGIKIDAEKSTKEYVNINDTIANISIKGTHITIFWSRGDCLFSIDSEGVSKEEIIRIAESVVQSK